VDARAGRFHTSPDEVLNGLTDVHQILPERRQLNPSDPEAESLRSLHVGDPAQCTIASVMYWRRAGLE